MRENININISGTKLTTFLLGCGFLLIQIDWIASLIDIGS